MIDKSVALVQEWSDSSFDVNVIAPYFFLDYAKSKHPDIPHDAPKLVVEFIREMGNCYRHRNGSSIESSMLDKDKLSSKKRRKLSNNGNISDPKPIVSAHHQRVENVCREIDDLYQKYSALFEWADGPLVRSMKEGSFLLVDEISKAKDNGDRLVMRELGSVLNMDGDTHVLLSTLSPGYVRAFLTGSNRYVLYVFLSPLLELGSVQCRPYSDYCIAKLIPSQRNPIILASLENF